MNVITKPSASFPAWAIIAGTQSEEIPQAKMLRILQLIIYLNRPRTIVQIASKLNVSPRTAYRYLKIFEEGGIAIDKNFHDQYFIAQDTCPICGKEGRHGK